MTARKGSPTRGDRLRPSRTSRVYWHLTKLRQAYEAAIAAHIAGGRPVVEHQKRGGAVATRSKHDSDEDTSAAVEAAASPMRSSAAGTGTAIRGGQQGEGRSGDGGDGGHERRRWPHRRRAERALLHAARK